MKFVLLFILTTLLTFGCSEKKKQDQDQGTDTKGLTRDTCSFCSIDSFRIKPCETEVLPKIIIDYPVAIEFFNQVKFVYKYERTKYDTVVKVLKMKHHGDRNLIYSLTEQYSYFQDLKRILIKNSIAVVDTIKREQFIMFSNRKTGYTIDIRRFYKNDGVLMFTPGKEPIFWTMKRDEENCLGYDGIIKWYFLCEENI